MFYTRYGLVLVINNQSMESWSAQIPPYMVCLCPQHVCKLFCSLLLHFKISGSNYNIAVSRLVNLCLKIQKQHLQQNNNDKDNGTNVPTYFNVVFSSKQTLKKDLLTPNEWDYPNHPP